MGKLLAGLAIPLENKSGLFWTSFVAVFIPQKACPCLGKVSRVMGAEIWPSTHDTEMGGLAWWRLGWP